MELPIKNLPLFILFQIATTYYVKPTQFFNFGPLLRSPRNTKASNGGTNGFAISNNAQSAPGFALPEKESGQFQLLPYALSQYNYNNDMQNHPQLSLSSNDIRRYRSIDDMLNQPQNIPILSQAMPQYESDSAIQNRLQEDPEYVQSLEVVNGYLQPSTKKVNEKFNVVDNTIKDRVATLQQFQRDFNKFLQDIANSALAFLSTRSFFGGFTRRSLFDPANMENIRTLHGDLLKLGQDFHQISSNVLADIGSAVRYISDHRNIGFKDLVGQAFRVALRIFTFP